MPKPHVHSIGPNYHAVVNADGRTVNSFGDLGNAYKFLNYNYHTLAVQSRIGRGVQGMDSAAVVVSYLVSRGRWFEFEPRPEDCYAIIVHEADAILLNEALAQPGILVAD